MSGAAGGKAAAGASPLRGLLDELALHAASRTDASRQAYPDLPLLEDVRQVWSTLSADRQLRQSSAKVPPNAGPLHSSVLVHRTLTQMREVSPGYLRQLMAYTEALSWLAQLDASAGAAGNAARAPDAKKPARGRAR